MEVVVLGILSLVISALLGVACVKEGWAIITMLAVFLSFLLTTLGACSILRFGTKANELLLQVANPVELTGDITMEQFGSLVKVEDYEGVKYYEPIQK